MRTQSFHIGSCMHETVPASTGARQSLLLVFVCLTLTLTHELCLASKQRVQRIHNDLTEGKQPLIIISNISEQLERTGKAENLHI